MEKEIYEIFDEDKGHEECAIVAISSAEGAPLPALIHNTLFEQQHRGQNAAGLAIVSDDEIIVRKDVGLVDQALPEKMIRRLPDKVNYGVGHVRYSTVTVKGRKRQRMAANPVYFKEGPHQLALVENGHINNLDDLLTESGHNPRDFLTDVWGLGRLLMDQVVDGAEVEDAYQDVLPKLDGAFAIAALTKNKIVAARDGHGFRPLAVGQRKDGWALASENGALASSAARHIREIHRGEMVTLEGDKLFSREIIPGKPERFCLMEFVYLLRPDTKTDGEQVNTLREELGRRLAMEIPIRADVVVGVPASGVPAAKGYSQASGIPEKAGFVKNHYVGRTFIATGQATREQKVRQKLRPLEDDVRDKSVLVIDDSIVRGTTTNVLVKMLREVGAREVHIGVTSPPYRYTCHYGLDTGDPLELLAADDKQIEEMRKEIGADGLYFLSLDSTMEAVKGKQAEKTVCTACFDGDYPTEHPIELQRRRNS